MVKVNQAIADDEFQNSFDKHQFDTNKNSKTLISNASKAEYSAMGKNSAMSPMFDQRMSVEFINNEGNNIFVNSINTIDQPPREKFDTDQNIEIENYLN